MKYNNNDGYFSPLSEVFFYNSSVADVMSIGINNFGIGLYQIYTGMSY